MPVSNYNEGSARGTIPEETDSNSANELLFDHDTPSPVILPASDAGKPSNTHPQPKSEPNLENNQRAFLNTVIREDASSTSDEDDDDSAMVVMPPDGGWGWVIVAASFICNFIVDGILYSFGVIINEIAGAFDVPTANVALVGSLLSGFYLIVGPFVSALSNRYGFRIVTIIGSILAAAAFALSAVAGNVEFLAFTYGIIGGIGFGMIYSPSIIIVGFYFEKWRALATGIAVCGSGIGTFVMAPLTEFCIDRIRWQGTMLVHAGILLVCGLCGILFRPLKPVKVTLEKSQEMDDMKALDDCVNEGHTYLTKAEIFAKRGSVASLKSNNLPTAAEILHISEGRKRGSQDVKTSKSTQSLNFKNVPSGHNDESSKERKRFSFPQFQDGNTAHSKYQKTTRSSSHPEEPNKSVSRSQRLGMNGNLNRRNTLGSVTECTLDSRRATITQLDQNINRPIYRDDIFFSGSLNRIPQYKTEEHPLSYRLSVTRLPTQNDLEEERQCRCFPEAMMRVIATMLDLSLMKSVSFVFLCASGFLTLFGLFVPFIYLADRAEKKIGKTEAVWLLSAIGITNTVGRILCGVFSSFPKVDALLINNLALTVGGISTLLSGLYITVAYQYTYAVVFGLSLACFASLRSIILVELLGLEKLTNAFGILLLFQGIAAVGGAPIAGIIMERTENYDAPFYFSGSLILISGLMLFPLRAIKRWEDGKAAEEIEMSTVI